MHIEFPIRCVWICGLPHQLGPLLMYVQRCAELLRGLRRVTHHTCISYILFGIRLQTHTCAHTHTHTRTLTLTHSFSAHSALEVTHLHSCLRDAPIPLFYKPIRVQVFRSEAP